MENEETIKLIEETLDKIRPFIERDGGDVQFDSFEDGIVYINLTGACQDCSMVNETIGGGIEIILMEEVPGVNGVRLASEKEFIKQTLKEIQEKEKSDN